MALPSVTQTILDPGLGLADRAGLVPLICGTSSSGTTDTVYTLTTVATAQSTLGQGPLAEAACLALQRGASRVLAVPMQSSVAAANSVVTEVAAGARTGAVTIGGTANDNYTLAVEITLGAVTPLESCRFRYSLDNQQTWSEVLVVPSGGTYLMPSSGITLTFTLGTGFDTGDLFTATCAPAYQNAADTLAAATAIKAIPSATTYDFICHAGYTDTLAESTAVWGQWVTEVAALFLLVRPVGVSMNTSSDSVSNVQTGYVASTDNRISLSYSYADITSAKAFAGWGRARMGLESIACAELCARLMSTDLGRVASGAISGVSAIAHDDYVTGGIDDYRITSMRTFPNVNGYYFTNGRMKSAAGSDFAYTQHRIIMDKVCRATYAEHAKFISMGLRTNSDGTIDERDAARLESRVNKVLRKLLLEPKNQEGTQGHVSEYSYAIDRTNNVLSTQTLKANVAIRPLGYPKWIEETLGYALEV